MKTTKAISIAMALMLLTGCSSAAEQESQTISTKSLASLKETTAVVQQVATPVEETVSEALTETETKQESQSTVPDEPQEATQPEVAEPVVAAEPQITPIPQNPEPAPTQEPAPQQAVEVQQPTEPTPQPQPEPTPQPEAAPAPVPEPAPEPTRPAFDAGTVIANASTQISGFMTRDSGPATGMGWFTFSFSVYDSMDKMAADLAAVMRQEHDVYGNTWFDIEYLGESSGCHNFKLYRA